ncbi:hypothetical protein WA538_004182 [Blastocystis sp. DL]
MSQAAFSLLSAGIKLKGLKNSDKDRFKKEKQSAVRSLPGKESAGVASSIDVFHYDTDESEKRDAASRKRERKDRKRSVDKGEEEGTEKEVKVDVPEEPKTAFVSEDELNEFRHRMHISVDGGDIPPPITTFDEMPFRKDQAALKHCILRNIEKSEYKEPTPIQMQSIPVLIQNRDILGIAPTGSGKTAAYLLPLLQKLDHPEKTHVRALVLTPTLELATQVHNHFTRLAAGSGLKSLVLSKATLAGTLQQSAVDCVVSTPLRLVSAISAKQIDFPRVETLILDEGDKLFEEGFLPQIDAILGACSCATLHRQLFSATLPPGVESLARTVLRDPVRVVVGRRNASSDHVTQTLKYCGTEEGKLLAFRAMLREGFEPPMLVFVQSKERARQLFAEVAYENVNVDVIHSDMSLKARQEAVTRFRTGDTWVLIATDLLGRGLDFLGLNTVLNYDFPQSGVDYVHRVGRTGRAGRKGTAITLFTEEDKPMLRSIANIMKISGCDVPEWMLQLKKIDKKERRRVAKHAVKRDDITTQAKFDKKKKVFKKKKPSKRMEDGSS